MWREVTRVAYWMKYITEELDIDTDPFGTNGSVTGKL
jgi:hypothetical protein